MRKTNQMARIISVMVAFVFIAGVLSGCERYEIKHIEINKHPNYSDEPGNSEFGHSHKKKKKEHDDD